MALVYRVLEEKCLCVRGIQETVRYILGSAASDGCDRMPAV